MLQRLDGWDIPRRVAAIGGYLLLLALLAASLPTIHVLARATAFTSDAVFRLPVRPLTWVTGDPSTVPFSWGGIGDEGDERGHGLLTLPAGEGAKPAIIVVRRATPGIRRRMRSNSASVARRSTRRCMALRTRSLMCCSGMSM